MRIAVLMILGWVTFSAAAKPGDVCARMRPQSEQYVEYGQVDGQMIIDPSHSFWGRMNYSEGSRLIEIERLWGWGAKTVRPEQESLDNIVGVHIVFDLRSPSVYGVGFWQLGWVDQEGVFTDLIDGRPFEILRPADGGWSELTKVFDEPVSAEKFKSLQFYARTLFHQPASLKNILTGTRVDACVYFLK